MYVLRDFLNEFKMNSYQKEKALQIEQKETGNFHKREFSSKMKKGLQEYFLHSLEPTRELMEPMATAIQN